MDKRKVADLMEYLLQLFVAFKFPGDENAYQALVEIAEMLRVKRNYSVHQPTGFHLFQSDVN